ncbi:MAG TPA: hypothetical protein VFV81_04340 [Verrucomicrobiae bacterium]|nr:hypothetical protein [Verrucomicrobiae bacterium]
MKHWLSGLLVVAAFHFAALSLQGATITWNPGETGAWSNPTNWSPHQVPGPSDTAVITGSGNYTVILDINANVSGLVLGAGDSTTQTLTMNGKTFTLAGQAALNPDGILNLSNGIFDGDISNGGAVLNGMLTCSGGALSGKITVATNSVVNFAGPSDPFADLLVLTNYGTVNWLNTDLSNASGFPIYNYGLWDAKTNKTFSGSGTVFNNYGIFRKSAGPGSSYFDSSVTFINFGTVDVQSGLLRISSGSGSGIFNTASNTAISFYPSFTLTGNPVFSGGGSIQGVLTGSNAVIQGALSFSSGGWPDCDISGELTIATNATLNLASENIPKIFNGILFTNYGTVNWLYTDLSNASSCQIYNYGLWDAKTNDTFSGSGTVFNNYGTFRKSGGSSLVPDPPYFSYFDSSVTFNNYGTVDVESGLLQISSGSGSGIFNTASNAATSFYPSFTLTGNPVFSGGGNIEGVLTGSNAVIEGALSFSSGGWADCNISGELTIATNATLNLASENIPKIFSGVQFTNYGTVNWLNTDLTSAANPQIYNYGLWDAQTNNTFSGSGTVFDNYGTFRKSGGTVFDTVFFSYFDNSVAFNNYGTVDVESGLLQISSGSGSGIFNTASNAATSFYPSFTLTGNPVFSGDGGIQGILAGNNAVIEGTLSFSSGGWPDSALSGVLTIATNATLNLVSENIPKIFSGVLFTNYGTVNWFNAELDSASSPRIYNYGLWDAKSNNLFSGSGTVFNNYGVLRKSGGAISDNGMETLLDNGVDLNNSGTIEAGAGLLVIGGNCALPGGTMKFDINGSGSFGTISISNGVMLTGTLSVGLNNGYSPALGAAFPLLTYGSATGSFSALNVPVLPSSLVWQTGYGATTFTLSVTTAPPAELSGPAMENGTNFSFNWSAVPGKPYQVQYTTNLTSTNWLNLGDPIIATNDLLSVTNLTETTPQTFYRVILP